MFANGTGFDNKKGCNRKSLLPKHLFMAQKINLTRFYMHDIKTKNEEIR